LSLQLKNRFLAVRVRAYCEAASVDWVITNPPFLLAEQFIQAQCHFNALQNEVSHLQI
jgi:hypothetical protein